MKQNRNLAGAIFPALLVILACASTTVPQQATITLNPEVTFQTILGWETTAEATPREGEYKKLFARYRDALCDLTVHDLGVNRIRLEIKNGAENPVDYFSLYEQGKISRQEYRERRYVIINDNDDPFTINPAGFHFAQVDAIVEELVLPIKQRLQTRGEKLYVNFNYVDFGPSAFEHQNYPEEYAEFMLAAFLHLQARYGWTPDAIEVVLESDNAGWTGEQLGQAIAATGKRLKAHGFFPAFIAPSTVSMENAAPFFDQLLQVPTVAQYVSELSYHRYGGVSDDNLQAIGSRATRYGIRTAQLEFIGANHHDLHKDLTLGRNSSWSQYTLAWLMSISDDDGGKYYLIDDRNPEKPVVLPGSRTKFLRQYFKYVRRGAVRIQATSSNSNFEPLAFVNADCSPIVVVKAADEGAFSIEGLPDGVYGIKYTTSTQYDMDHPDEVARAGQPLKTTIPEAGVITIYAKSVSCTGLADVSAANYRNAELAAESIVAAFGKNLAVATLIAEQNPLPITLGGTVVKIKDAVGVERLAPLFFISPYQINYQIPPGTAPGPATISVINSTRLIAGPAGVTIARVAPGLFTANVTGLGVAAAVVLRVKGDNSQSYEPVSQFDVSQGQFVPLPIDLGPDLGAATDKVLLLLFGTGIRGYGELSAVKAKIGGVEAPVVQAQPLADYTGLDQVALLLPRTLAGRGVTEVLLTVEGRLANPVSVYVK